MKDAQVKVCPKCKATFAPADLFVSRDLHVLGMNVDPIDHSLNFYYFQHTAVGCDTTFCIHVEFLQQYIDRQSFNRVLTGTENCHGHCEVLTDHQACTANCKWAPFRRLLWFLKERRLPDVRPAKPESAEVE